MAKDLKSMCASGESVVFVARFSWLKAIERGLGVGFVMVLMVWLYKWTGVSGSRHDAFILFPAIFFLWMMLIWSMRFSFVLVTDKRLIYRSAQFRPNVAEIPLGSIDKIGQTPGAFGFGGRAIVWENSGRATPIENVPQLDALVTAVSSLTGRSAPTKISPKIKNLFSASVGLITIGGYVGCLILGFVVFRVLDPDLLEIGNRLAAAYFHIFALFLPLLAPAVVLCSLAGSIPAFFAIRLFLMPEEAEELLRIGLVALKPGMTKTLARWSHRFSAWVLSRLYGQKIRCD